MNIGKIPETILKRSVLNQIRHKRDEVLLGPLVGEDCSMVGLSSDEVLLMSTDPVTGGIDDFGLIAVNVSANNIAGSGGEPLGIMLSILLPVDTLEKELKKLMYDVEIICEQLNIDVLGGHTELSNAVNQPVITVTGIGKIKKEDIIKKSNVLPGQEIVMTKWAGIEGTSILAKEKEKDLLTKYSLSFIKNAQEMLKYISIVPEAKIAKGLGVSSMHDIRSGGIFAALWEIGAASKVGLEVDLNKILLKQETVEICEFFDLNPYMLTSSGSMLVITDKANYLVDQLKEAGIAAAVIGHIKEGNERVIINQGEKRYLEPPKLDEIYKLVCQST
ncbi:MAG: hydrogenase maturation factor [Clostridiales bacterium]|nr:hydrogenase maturation factor [Clostridiales bacterium]